MTLRRDLNEKEFSEQKRFFESGRGGVCGGCGLVRMLRKFADFSDSRGSDRYRDDGSHH
jgi:hypothetical protein